MNDEEQIKENLKNIPHCYTIRDCLIGRSNSSIKCIIDRLLSELDHCIYELDMEWLRTYNFISFLNWIIGKRGEAKVYNEKALNLDENNVIAIANKVWFSLESKDAYEVKTTYSRLQEIQNSHEFSTHRIKAEAELAYCYTRLGLKYQDIAAAKFKEAINSIDTKIDKNLIMLWKYGLGLISRRLSKLHSTRDEEQIRYSGNRRKDAIRIFLEVIEQTWDSKRLKAMAYVQLGELAYDVSKTRFLQNIYFPSPYDKWNEERFYQTALKLNDKETYVLERYGKLLRYRKNYDQSEKLLRKAIEIRHTSYAHHHLALTLKSKLHRDLVKKSRTNKTSNWDIRNMAENEPVPSDRGHRNQSKHIRNLFPSDYSNAVTAHGFQSVNSSNMHNERRYHSGYHSGPMLYNHYMPISNAAQYDQLNDSALSFTHNSKSRRHYKSRKTESGLNRFQGNNSYCFRESDNRTSTNKRIDDQYNDVTYERKEQYNLYSRQRIQANSEVDELASAFQQVSLLQKNVEKDGSVKMKTNSLTSGPINAHSWTSGRNKTESETLKCTFDSSMNKDQAKVMVKSPKKPLSLPEEDERTKEILFHLEQAIVYNENRAAVYDKGLTLRAMKKLDEAIDVFKTLLEDETSLVYLANAYEQLGLCYSEKIIASCNQNDDTQKCDCNMKDCFMKSVAISVKLVTAIPDITDVWSSASSLKMVLLSGGKSKENLKQLAVLNERLSNYKEAISYYKKLIRLEDCVQDIPKHMLDIAKNQMKDSNFVAAVTFYDLIRSHPEGSGYIDKEMYIKCLIEAGFQTVKTGKEKQFRRKYLTSALEYASPLVGNQDAAFTDSEEVAADQMVDIFLLCCEQNKRPYEMAVNLLYQLKEDCCLNATLNSLDVSFGVPELSGTLRMIDRCKYFLIFIKQQESNDKIYQLSIEHIVLNKSKVVVILEDENVKPPAVIHRFKDRIPYLVCPIKNDSEKKDLNWLKKLLACMLGVKST